MPQAKEMKKSIWCILLCIVMIYAIYYKSHSHVVSGTEEIHYGTVMDRAMHPVELKDRYMPWDRNRAYIGIEFIDGSGDCFWLADGYECPEGIQIGDYICVEIATERWTDFQIITRVEEMVVPLGVYAHEIQLE